MRKQWNLLITASEIADRILSGSALLQNAYAGEELVLVGILNGALFFLSDLARAITSPIRVDTMLLQSYNGGLASGGTVALVQDIRCDIRGKRVVLVDDIYDSGRTLRFALDHLAARQPKSLDIACLLVKDAPRAAPVEVRFGFFPIPNEFVVGYGLDIAGLGRNLPDIWSLPPGSSEEAAALDLLEAQRGLLKPD